MTNTTTKTYIVGVIQRGIDYFQLEAEDARSAAEKWLEGEYWGLDTDTREYEGPCNVQEEQPDGTFLELPRPQWEAVSPTRIDLRPKPYSVLLLYPDYANDSGIETYYALVEAPDPLEAIEMARAQAVTAQEGVDTLPDDFAPLLVTGGHHHSEALFNK